MRALYRWAGVTVLAAVGCAAGCSSQSTATAPEAGNAGTPANAKDQSRTAVNAKHEVNDVCPITGDTIDPKMVAAHRGSKIAFCCEHCLREFREMDEAGKDAILAKTYPTERK